MRIGNFLRLLLFLASVEGYTQSTIDTTGIIADGINQSRTRLKDVLTTVKGEEKEVIFVKIDNIIAEPQYKKACDYDSIVVLFTREVQLFHFGIWQFIEIEKISLKRNSMRVSFRSLQHFNKPGPYNGYMVFTKKSENWEFESLKLK